MRFFGKKIKNPLKSGFVRLLLLLLLKSKFKLHLLLLNLPVN